MDLRGFTWIHVPRMHAMQLPWASGSLSVCKGWDPGSLSTPFSLPVTQREHGKGNHRDDGRSCVEPNPSIHSQSYQ